MKTYRSTLVLILSGLLISQTISGQRSSNTLGDSRFDNSEIKFGKFLLEMPSGARLYEADETSAEEFIGNIKSSCKGNAIFLDFWATWCSPCIKEMPNNKRLFFEAQELPLDFIYLCTSYETDIDTWITKVSTLRQPGIHIFVEGDLLTKVMRKFSVGGYPSYVFIDSEGNYKKDAVPPQSSTTIEVLKELLKK